jgi:hypothetical protein
MVEEGTSITMEDGGKMETNVVEITPVVGTSRGKVMEVHRKGRADAARMEVASSDVNKTNIVARMEVARGSSKEASGSSKEASGRSKEARSSSKEVRGSSKGAFSPDTH